MNKLSQLLEIETQKSKIEALRKKNDLDIYKDLLEDLEEKEKNIFPEGQGWEVVSEASFEEGKKNQVNPAFAKLKVLLDGQDNDKDNKNK